METLSRLVGGVNSNTFIVGLVDKVLGLAH
jgi:hypothetical protein